MGNFQFSEALSLLFFVPIDPDTKLGACVEHEHVKAGTRALSMVSPWSDPYARFDAGLEDG